MSDNSKNLPWWLRKLVQFAEWRNRNYVPPVLTEWEQTRYDAQLDAAARALAEEGRIMPALRFINGKSRKKAK